MIEKAYKLREVLGIMHQQTLDCKDYLRNATLLKAFEAWDEAKGLFTVYAQGEFGKEQVIDPEMDLNTFLEGIQSAKFGGLHIGGPRDMGDLINAEVRKLVPDVDEAWRQIIHLGMAMSTLRGGYKLHKADYLCKLTEETFEVTNGVYHRIYGEPLRNWRAKRPLTYEDCKP